MKLFVSALVVAAAGLAQEQFVPLLPGYIGLQAEVGALEFRAIEVSER